MTYIYSKNTKKCQEQSILSSVVSILFGGSCWNEMNLFTQCSGLDRGLGKTETHMWVDNSLLSSHVPFSCNHSFLHSSQRIISMPILFLTKFPANTRNKLAKRAEFNVISRRQLNWSIISKKCLCMDNHPGNACEGQEVDRIPHKPWTLIGATNTGYMKINLCSVPSPSPTVHHMQSGNHGRQVKVRWNILAWWLSDIWYMYQGTRSRNIFTIPHTTPLSRTFELRHLQCRQLHLRHLWDETCLQRPMWKACRNSLTLLLWLECLTAQFSRVIINVSYLLAFKELQETFSMWKLKFVWWLEVSWSHHHKV